MYLILHYLLLFSLIHYVFVYQSTGCVRGNLCVERVKPSDVLMLLCFSDIVTIVSISQPNKQVRVGFTTLFFCWECCARYSPGGYTLRWRTSGQLTAHIIDTIVRSRSFRKVNREGKIVERRWRRWRYYGEETMFVVFIFPQLSWEVFVFWTIVCGQVLILLGRVATDRRWMVVELGAVPRVWNDEDSMHELC